MMNVKHTLSALLLAGLATSTLAQEKEEPVKRVRVTDFYLTSGLVFGSSQSWNITDFQNLAPNSTLLNQDFSGYNPGMSDDKGMPFDMNTNQQITMMIGMNFSDKNKTEIKGNPHFRVGVTYRNGSLVSGDLSRIDRFTFDTLTSSGGSAYSVDSVFHNSYKMNYSTQQLHLDASLVFRTSPERRASLFGGIGVMAGMGINSRTTINYKQHQGTIVNYPSYQSDDFGMKDNGEVIKDSESIKNKAAFGFNVYVPMGLDLRLCNKNEFWKRVHLSLEMRPGLSMVSSPELGLLTSFSSFHGLGLKIFLR
jgi:opacity protein-like surface antigen